jgi:hypothetical protein
VDNACRVLKVAVVLSVKDVRKRTLSFIDAKLSRSTCVLFLREAVALNPGLENVERLSRELVVENLHWMSAKDVSILPPDVLLGVLYARFRQEHRECYKLNRTLTTPRKREPDGAYDDEGKDHDSTKPPLPSLPNDLLCRYVTVACPRI